ncbi:MAG: hypothetical protein IJ512_00595 [Ruminococcus sp.]|nr:hypothetical protein [Ruminococcus sp.]
MQNPAKKRKESLLHSGISAPIRHMHWKKRKNATNTAQYHIDETALSWYTCIRRKETAFRKYSNIGANSLLRSPYFFSTHILFFFFSSRLSPPVDRWKSGVPVSGDAPHPRRNRNAFSFYFAKYRRKDIKRAAANLNIAAAHFNTESDFLYD